MRQNSHWLRLLIIIILLLGIIFRFANIDSKVYWHDEVYTSIRTTGYQGEEISNYIFSNRIITPQELLKFQTLKPGSTAIDTIKSLAVEDPQHPPFYFLLGRFWQSLFGYSLISSRTLPILISLLSLLLIYLLALELFNSQLAAILSVILLAISPCDILFAQIARQYSLLTFMVILSYLFLWKAIKQSTFKNWIFYSLTGAIGLYSHVFFVLTLVGQGVFIVLNTFQKQQNRQKLLAFLLSISSILILYLPWINVLANNYVRAMKSTSWVYAKLDIIHFFKLWILSFTCLFTDIDFGFDNALTYLYRLLYIILIVIALYTLYRKTNWSVFLLIITSILVPFLLLVIPDIILETRRSTVTRYLISCFPGVQLAVAYLLADKLATPKRLWQIIFALILTNSIISNSINTVAEVTWTKIPSHLNSEIARQINAISSPLVISDRSDVWINLGELISLSYLLDKDVKFYLTSYPPNQKRLEGILKQPQTDILVFHPSEKLKIILEQITGKSLESIYKAGNLWRINS